ncbi:MAG: SDR family NAD(P)-dependent oxidoreductase [Gemmatimonadales bacterium]|jgi:serine 3-dehydrogenase|nr:MAG: SDR family NAD(P)-dependent oxidoreductase [Gemmatimonadales bacterium]
MNRLQGRTALITGATAGIGQACARALAALEVHLVLVGRRAERLQALATELREAFGVDIYTRALDVRDRDAVMALPTDLVSEGVQVDLLVNNAGKALGLDLLHEGDLDDWDEMVDTNVKGLLYFSRAFLPGMVERNRGHVVNVGSTAGRWTYPRGAVYCGTKFSVRGISEGMNMDLAGTRVRVSSVDPGLVETEFSEVRFHGDKERAEAVYQGYTPLTANDIADAVVYVANAPEHVDIFNMVILPTDQRHSMIVHKESG